MDEEEKQPMNEECNRKLINFNAPLLSTKRPVGMKRLEISSYANSKCASRDFCDRVPFSWEKTPGNPKDVVERSYAQIVDLLPPKLPPGRRLPTTINDYDDGDVDEYEYDDYDRDNSVSCRDTISVHIMDETRDEVEALGMVRNLETEDYYSGAHSPSYIIRRFLPDAKALAASSALNFSENNGTSISRAISVRLESYCSMKSCGLYFFNPWRLKPKPCGVKSSVPAAVLRDREKLQWSRREKEK